MKTLVLLQNAYSWLYTHMDQWHYDSWIKALRKSRSGKRLTVMIGEDWSDYHFSNTTPIIGKLASSKHPPDDIYFARIINEISPRLVIACGLQAKNQALRIWPGNLVCIPHPASRVLTNELLKYGSGFLDHEGRIILHQQRGRVQKVTL